MNITPRAAAPDTYLAYASQSDLPNRQQATQQSNQKTSSSAKVSSYSQSSETPPLSQRNENSSDSLTLSKEAMARLQQEQEAKQGAAKPAHEQLKDQMLSQRQQELNKGNKTNAEVKQEQIQATKDEIKKVKDALRKLQHEEGKMVEKQRDQLNLALVQLNTQLLELMRS